MKRNQGDARIFISWAKSWSWHLGRPSGTSNFNGRSGCLACLEQASFRRRPVQVSARNCRYCIKLICLNRTCWMSLRRQHELTCTKDQVHSTEWMFHVYCRRIANSWDLQQIPTRGFKRDSLFQSWKCSKCPMLVIQLTYKGKQVMIHGFKAVN